MLLDCTVGGLRGRANRASPPSWTVQTTDAVRGRSRGAGRFRVRAHRRVARAAVQPAWELARVSGGSPPTARHGCSPTGR